MSTLSRKLFRTQPIYLKGGKIANKHSIKPTLESLDNYIPKSNYDTVEKYLKPQLNNSSKNHTNVPPIMNSENHPEVDSIVDFDRKKGRPKKNLNDNVVFEVK